MNFVLLFILIVMIKLILTLSAVPHNQKKINVIVTLDNILSPLLFLDVLVLPPHQDPDTIVLPLLLPRLIILILPPHQFFLDLFQYRLLHHVFGLMKKHNALIPIQTRKEEVVDVEELVVEEVINISVIKEMR